MGMKKYYTQEEIDKVKEVLFFEYLKKFNGKIILKKPIRFRETPHMPTVYIDQLSIKDDFNSYGLARDSILQRLRFEISKLEQ